MADLRGKVAVVTGASRGLGRGIAEGLAEAGATVVLTGRTESFAEPPAEHSLQRAARQVEALGGRALPLALDHTRESDVRTLFERVLGEHGRLDLLVELARPGFHPAWPLAEAAMGQTDGGLIVVVSPAAAAPPAVAAGVTALSLVPAPVPAHPRFTGRCVAALAMDPDVAEKAGGGFHVAELCAEYRFTDPHDDPWARSRLEG